MKTPLNSKKSFQLFLITFIIRDSYSFFKVYCKKRYLIGTIIYIKEKKEIDFKIEIFYINFNTTFILIYSLPCLTLSILSLIILIVLWITVLYQFYIIDFYIVLLTKPLKIQIENFIKLYNKVNKQVIFLFDIIKNMNI